METPGAIRHCLGPEVSGPIATAAEALAGRGVRRVFLLGCGSSYFAALATAYALHDLAGIDADAYDAFEFDRYRADSAAHDACVLTFSHSGNTKVTVEAAKNARERGMFTVCLTDIPDSPLAQHADLVIPVGGGREAVEPKTRSFVNTLVVGYQLAAYAGRLAGTGSRKSRSQRALEQYLPAIPGILDRCVALEEQARLLALKYAGIKRVFVVGGGPNYATALEIALKFKEAVLMAGEGFEVEEAFHGPIASLDLSTLVIAASVPGHSYEKVGHFVKAASMIGSPVISVTTDPYSVAGVAGVAGIDTIQVPVAGIPETFSNAVLAYPLYMLCYHSALARGNNPDVFRLGDRAFHEAIAAVPSISIT